MEEKFKDLLDDEELTALRLAALASKRKKLENTDNSSDSVSALPINSIVSSSASTSESSSNQIPFVQSDRNVYNYTWRKQIQSSRRRGGAFPKNNQRSNLIVISPVSLNDGKDSEEKISALLLPQHKWCNSGNEDSLSPKTLRRGPTRFNRHGSDSESSDSDYENSENDSGSNETVLQDEPPEHFSRLSPESAVSDNVEKQRRLSFQNLETEIQSDAFEKSETTSVYNCLKNSSSSLDYANSKSDNFVSVQNLGDNRHDWNSSVANEYSSYKQYNSGHSYSAKPVDSSEGFVEKQNSCVMSNGETHINETNSLITQSSDNSVWQPTGVKASNSYYSRDISAVPENAKNRVLNDKKSKDYTDKRQSFQISSEIQGTDSSVWQHGERVRMNSSYFSRDTSYNKTVARNYSCDNVNSKEKVLSGDDLRLELKKRMQEIQSKPTVLENCNEIVDHKKTDQNNTWDRSKHRYTFEEERIEVSCPNPYGNRQDLDLNLSRNRQERSCSRERDRDEHSINLNRRRRHRSLSRERNKQDASCGRDRNRSEYNFGPEKIRYDRSSSLDKSRQEFSSSRGRSRLERSSSRGRLERSSSRGRLGRSSSRGRFERSSSRGRSKHERSSSRGRSRHERSSSKGKVKYECDVQDSNKHERSQSQDRNKHEYRSSQERDKHDHSVGRNRSHLEHSLTEDKDKHNRDRSRYERRYSPDRKRYAHNGSQDRNRHECWSSRNHSRSDRSSSEDSRHGHSSSSDSKQERSLSRDRSRREYSSSQERRRHKRSRSQDRSRHKHSHSWDRNRQKKSPSEDRNRHDHSYNKKRSSHERSQSQDSRSDHTPTQDRSRQERSLSQDRNKHEHNSSQCESGDECNETKSRHEHNSNGTKSVYKCSSSQGKSKLGVTSSDERNNLECASGQENIGCTSNLKSRKLESVRVSDRIKDDKRFEKTSTKEQCENEERNRSIHSRSQEKSKGNKRLLQKPKYEDSYSRSRSSSTTSCSSSCSSSSSHSSRPKIRSVPSVIKSFQPKSLDADKKETFCEIKLAGKNISASQLDISSTSIRKDGIDYNKFSNIKCGRVDGDPKATDSNKRVPVHMRLGVLPRKRLIQMPKDVEAAFVNSSSSSDGENVNAKCKRQNIRIVTDVYGSKSGLDCEKKHSGKEKSAKRSPDIYQEKSKRVKTHR